MTGFGVLLKNEKGDFVPLTGNQIGTLMMEYILSQMKEKGKLESGMYVTTSIVSSNLSKEIAKEYGVKYYEALTGFKNLCSISKDPNEKFLFGFEESFGYLYGRHAKDKDGVVACMLILEMIAYYAKKDMTLLDVLEKMYMKYGYYREFGKSVVLKGIEGKKKIASKMEELRNTKIEEIGGNIIVRLKDYQKGIEYDCKEQTKKTLDEQKSNVLYYDLDNGTWIAVRPSGTEPKIKFYVGVKGKTKQEADLNLEKVKRISRSIILVNNGKMWYNICIVYKR